MNRTEYDQLRALAESEYREKLAALDLVYQLSQRLKVPEEQRTMYFSASFSRERETDEAELMASNIRPDVLGAVALVINHLSSGFTWMDVHEQLQRHHPDQHFHDGSVRQVVRKLEERGVLKVLKPGAGRSPTLYTK